jgi:hypothetical protein
MLTLRGEHFFFEPSFFRSKLAAHDPEADETCSNAAALVVFGHSRAA